MTETNDVLGQSGAGELVESLGQAWSLDHVGPAHRARFGAWVKLRARREIQSMRQSLGESAYRDDLAAFHAECAAGSYNWGSPFSPDGMGPAVAAALEQPDGQLCLIGLLLESRHGALPPERLREVVAGNEECFGEALLACMRLPDPNRPAPAAGAKATGPGGATKSPATA